MSHMTNVTATLFGPEPGKVVVRYVRWAAGAGVTRQLSPRTRGAVRILIDLAATLIAIGFVAVLAMILLLSLATRGHIL